MGITGLLDLEWPKLVIIIIEIIISALILECFDSGQVFVGEFHPGLVIRGMKYFSRMS